MASSFATAPIMMTTYRRLDHVKRTLEALAANTLAAESDLFITSDGPLDPHRDEVMAVREHLATVSGFRSVTLFARDQNDRLENWRVRRRLLEQHGRLVYLEEDCVTAPGFLAFINAGLERYQDDPTVFSISGYLPPLPGIPSDPPRLLRLGRFNSWGYGIFARSEQMVRCQPEAGEYNRLLDDPAFRRRVNHTVGLPWFGMFRKVCLGEMLAFDVMANLEVLKRQLSVIHPSRSLVDNIGIDGSGEHCGEGERFQVQLEKGLDHDWLNLPEDSTPAASRGIADFYTHGIRRRWKFLTKRLRGRLHLPDGLAMPDRSL